MLFSRSVVSDSLWPHGLWHTTLPWPSPTPRARSNSCALNRWHHPTISFSVVPFSSSSCLQSFPASGFFPMSQSFASSGQSIGASVSASVLLMDIQGWFPLDSLIKSQFKKMNSSFSNAFRCPYLNLNRTRTRISMVWHYLQFQNSHPKKRCWKVGPRWFKGWDEMIYTFIW